MFINYIPKTKFIDKNIRFVVSRGEKVGSRWGKGEKNESGQNIFLVTKFPKKGNAKECSNYRTIALISHASKLMLKILQARLQQYANHEFPDVQASFKKGRGTTDQIANIHWIIEKAREFYKNIYFCFIDYAKAFDVWITINCGKFFKTWEYQTT